MTTSGLQNPISVLSRAEGSLLAGAVGDALGYEIEFDSYATITSTYGPKGVTGYKRIPAFISDDTQMTLFTAEGLIESTQKYGTPDDNQILGCVTEAYLRWYSTQTGLSNGSDGLLAIPELWVRRAPGITCMSALGSIMSGQTVDNSSKGCGGIMRIAPVGILAASFPEQYDNLRTARLAGKSAFITHHHPLSTVSSAIAAVIIRNLLLASTPASAKDYRDIAEMALEITAKVFPGAGRSLAIMKDLLDKTFDTVLSSADDNAVVSSLGEGWVAEETLAIALASVMRYPDDLRGAIIMAVNHDGDSDSTGAVTGNIIGASLGIHAIPEDLSHEVELRSIIIDIAGRLCGIHKTQHA